MSDLSNYKKHPIYENYSSDEYGNIKNSNLSCNRYCTIDTSHDYNCVNHIYECGIIINYYDRYEVIYPINKFIWECFYGLIPSNKIVIRKNKNHKKKIKRINNLKCIDYKYIPFKCEKKLITIKDFKNKTIAELKN